MLLLLLFSLLLLDQIQSLAHGDIEFCTWSALKAFRTAVLAARVNKFGHQTHEKTHGATLLKICGKAVR